MWVCIRMSANLEDRGQKWRGGGVKCEFVKREKWFGAEVKSEWELVT